jgi:hypothetical protein
MEILDQYDWDDYEFVISSEDWTGDKRYSKKHVMGWYDNGYDSEDLIEGVWDIVIRKFDG